MRGVVRRATAVAAAAVVAALAAGCGSAGEDAPAGGGTLIDAEGQSPPVLNVLLPEGVTVSGQRLASNIQQNLLTSDETGRFVPQLAVAVPGGADVREGPLRVTFRIDPKARWSDGPPVTSADVAFTWRTMIAERNQVASRSGWERIRAIRAGRTASGGACPPATCFTVEFDGDYAPWRDVFSVSGGNYILPRHVLQGRDFNTVWNTGGIVGSGPFTLKSFTPGVRAVLERDPDWWGAGPADGRAGVERIVFNFLGSPGAAVQAVREGEAQMTSPPPDPDLIDAAKRIDGTTVSSVPSLFFEHIVLNTERPPLDDPRVRRALAYAIDRQQIVDVMLDGTVPVLQSVVRPIQLGYEPAYARYGYDPGHAAALLEAAGWTRGADGYFAKDGRRLSIPLLSDSESVLRGTTARLIAQQAKAAGIRIEPRQLPGDRIFGSLLNEGDFSAVMVAFGGAVDPSLTGLLASDQIPTQENGFAGQNVYRWRDPEADSLMRLSDRQVDDAARAATLGRVQEIVADQVPLIPLYAQPNTVVATTALHGVRENPTQAEVFWNSGEWALGGAGG
jgi:peptide/nickel transport system substrate-binding protein